jgi:hypothetical protein
MEPKMNNNILTKNRECTECPPHFTRVRTQKITKLFGTCSVLFNDSKKNIRTWCYENVDNRFFVGNHVEFNNTSNIMVEYQIAAFEDPRDATYFSLMLPTFKMV